MRLWYDCLAMAKRPPKLPRFQAPKSMASKVYKTKKDKARTRRALDAKLKKDLKDNED